MTAQHLRIRIFQALAIIGFIFALLMGGGAPHDFIMIDPTPTPTMTRRS